MENTVGINTKQGDQAVPPENLFFNVMPQKTQKTQTPVQEKPAPEPVKRVIIQAPVVSKQETFEQPKAATGRQIGKIIKKIATTTVVILILAGLGYAGYWGYGKVPQLSAKLSKFNLFASKSNEQKPPQPKQEEEKKVNFATTPKSWLLQYFGSEQCEQENVCGDNADPDKDGLVNLEEQRLATDPNNSDSDKDGIADGDEVHITLCDPLHSNTAGNEKYNDADDFRGGYDCRRPQGSDETETPEEMSAIAKRMAQYGLHEPTIGTIKDYGDKYKIIEPVSSQESAGSSLSFDSDKNSLPDLVEKTPEAMLQRDTQRAGTIKKIGLALIKFKKDASYFPQTNSFFEMLSRVKPYNQVATNPTDPLNRDAFVYTYTTNKDASDFTLTYFSETQNQLIKYTSANAEKDSNMDAASENDDRRIRDLENIRSALLIYSTANVAGSQKNVFPTESKYIQELVPRFISDIPKDPKTNLEYEYKVSKNYDSFTLKALLEDPPNGTTSYVCDPDDCQNK